MPAQNPARKMYLFVNDYSEGALPEILDALTRTNLEQQTGYGVDAICDRAREAIMKELDNQNSRVHFAVGGTQANLMVISALLRTHQGVLSAETGHIAIHETGAIEATGHKVLTLPPNDGKISVAQVESYVQEHYTDANGEHTVQPKMVYISQPTEFGTTYTKQEMEDLSAVCKKLNLIFFVDGARLGCALTAEGNDVSLADMARLTDVFYIGGTKMGALFGEAIVINNPVYNEDFRYVIKQKGGMMAKGRLLGVQFLTLFEDGLYYRAARHANACSERLREGIRALGFNFLTETKTNQTFAILPKDVLDELGKSFGYSVWQKMDDNQIAIRLVTSWATDMKMVESFINTLEKIKNNCK